MKPADVSAILITKGDVDLTQIIYTLRNFRQVYVVASIDRSAHSLFRYPDVSASYPLADLKVYGRYDQAFEYRDAHALMADFDGPAAAIAYVQDDDCITDPEAIVAAYEPGVVVCNMPAEFRPNYQDGVALVGFGAVFDVDLAASAFDRYLARYPMDDLFLTECDRVFTKLNRCKFVDVPKVDLPHAFDATRLYKRSDHHIRTADIRLRLENL